MIKTQQLFRNKILYRFIIILLAFQVVFFTLPVIGEEIESPEEENKINTEVETQGESNEEDFELKQEFKSGESLEENSKILDTESQELNEFNVESSEDKNNENVILKGHVSKVPGGTKLKIILETPIDEITSMTDDNVVAKVAENVLINGEIIIPAGSTVTGKISEINSAKRLHRAGSVRIEFKNLSLPNSREIPIVASILTHSGLIKGKYSKKAALISSATILGPAAAGLGAGLAAEGSAIGAGIGAGLGLLTGLGIFAFQRGNKVDLMSGDELSIELVEEALVPVDEQGEKKYCSLKERP